ncbi:peptidylprolyl isomerase fpr3 [Tilletia horrida]|nr:peptidylprolyl isomerase fpr3 [Tilletia horrida]
MAAPPLSLFALRVPGGGEVIYPETYFKKDFVISSISFADTLPDSPDKKRHLVKVHHTPVEDDDSDDDDDDYDFSDELDDDDDEDQDDEEGDVSANGAEKLNLGKHELDVSKDELDAPPEEEAHVLCSLIPNSIETVTGLNVHCAAEDLVGFSVTGPYAVDLIGSFVVNLNHMNQEPDSDEEIDSDIYGESSDEDEYDSEDAFEYFDDEDDDEELDPALAGLLNPEDSGEEEDPSRFEEVGSAPASSAKGKGKKAAAAVNGKKRGAAAAGLDSDGDASMSSAAAASESADLSRNQRKRLNKKAKAQSDAVAAASTVGDDSTASTASSKAKKVSFKQGEIDGPSGSGAPPSKGDVSASSVTSAISKKDKAAAAVAGKKGEANKKDKKEDAEKPKAAAAAAAAAGNKANGRKKMTTASGLVIEDVKIGTGPQAKTGQRVGMRYIGKLTSGKQFDANTSGKPFYFKLGRGEVIKGWDEGVKGMTIGSERRLTVPPQLAYGSQKLPGLPPNSTLVFDVKLVDIK